MPRFKDKTIPDGQYWSPLGGTDKPIEVEAVLDHPRVLLDPGTVLPVPEPEESGF